MIINVGSLNRVKRRAVREAAAELFGKVKLRSYRVDSGVSHTPSTDAEILRGAARRAVLAYRRSPADLGVGLEGGVSRTRYGPILKGWAAVFDGREIYVGGTPGIPLPRRIMEGIKRGAELARLMDAMTGIEDVRSKQGAFGVLTRNRITRMQSFKLALYCAFSPLVNKGVYEKAHPPRGVRG